VESKVIVELCRTNLVWRGGGGFPQVIESREVSRDEADDLLALPMVNGYYWREVPPDIHIPDVPEVM
jgi:hypothetical protein